jgi:hypothetical protein
MKEIQVSGTEMLDEKEKEEINKILNNYFPKIQRSVKNPATLKVHIKEYKKEGKGKKYSISSEIKFSDKKVTSDSWDWDLAKAIHKSMIKIENEIEHKFHSSNQY